MSLIRPDGANGDAERFLICYGEAAFRRSALRTDPHAHAKLPAYSQLCIHGGLVMGTKATCLWLKNLPVLIPTEIVQGRWPKVHFESPDRIAGNDGPNRGGIGRCNGQSMDY